MKLQANERVLTGSWTHVRDSVRGDEVCKRIEWLVGNELKRIASSPQWGDWETLFQDPSDGRYWERTYPLGHLQGGGPPQLKVIATEEAKAKYRI